MRRLSALAMCMLLGFAGRTFAQGAPLERVRIVIGTAGNEPLSTFAESFARTRNLESAPITADLTVSRSPVFDGGARIRFWRANSLGVAATETVVLKPKSTGNRVLFPSVTSVTYSAPTDFAKAAPPLFQVA